MTKDKVIRIQGDRLCKYLGYPPGTKIEIEEIRKIANGEMGDIVVANDRSVTITMSMIGIAMILLEKICS